MKYFSLFILLCYSHTISAQNLIANNSFELNAGNDVTLGICPACCITFSNGSMPGWIISHGSPHLANGIAPDQSWHLSMWTYTNQLSSGYGEGVYNQLLTPVVNGEYYNFCFWYKTSSGPDNGNGTVVCELTNQLTSSTGYCGGYPPPMTIQNITPSSAVFPQATWTYVSGTFQANANYTYLRIYPCCSSAPGTNVATLEVDAFTLSAAPVCSGTLNMNNNVVYNPAIGFYERYSIIAGSTAAIPNGTMMVINPAVSMTFKGNTDGYIELVNDFISEPDNDHYFETILGPCGCPGDEDPRRIAKENHPVSEPGIYPNPTSGSFTLKKENDEVMDIEIFDFTGRSVFSQKNLAGETFIFDLSNQPNGVYLVRIVSGTEINTMRLIKN